MVTAVVAAAGSGRRMGKEMNKVFLPLAGRPILARSVAAVAACPEVADLVVVVAPGEEEQAAALIAPLALAKPWRVVAGGAERQHSVANALAAMPDAADIILIHDGARPLVDAETISAAIAAAREHGAAGVAVPVKDTIKTVDESGCVAATPDRSTLWAIQTPQVFAASLLREAYALAAAAGVVATDDAALVERLGQKVRIVPGSYRNIKITTPEDMVMAQALLGNETKATSRIGIGYDVHRLVAGRPLIIGGVDIPYEKGLEGHSDADVLLHAVKDALLGAAALGDIGRHFPDTDPAYKGASSVRLLAAVGEKLAAAGWRAANIDAVVIAEKPKLAPHIPAMNANIAAALGIDAGRVNVKATTTEGLGFTGRREGIAAQAVAAIEPAG
ncbi:2-C-methyl-D-erythritol 4-phosphate cytidylyltransferase [Anaeroselena agilis]|uniref:Bifunctional enzyme IspD/IspF n=1 Tax=Anaeroselena agilis TaxID=3063788 RepID=A0ABU3P113_9FIRM|nr:2-C-methyl-D-erythritol 4-phosphate cytidylyltransferase [Selenomonadales bacterium 4137-cl]